MLDRALSGTIRLEDTGVTTMVTGEIGGLKDGKHGFHVHEVGALGYMYVENFKNFVFKRKHLWTAWLQGLIIIPVVRLTVTWGVG